MVNGNQVIAHWADKKFRLTEKEAVIDWANSDIKYHGPHLDRAKAILKAIENGEDYQHLLGELD